MEHQSLLPVRDDTLITTTKTTLRSINYGVNEESVGKSIALQERITYTWNDLNMFAEQVPSIVDQFRSCFRKRRIVHKHILKHVSGVAYPGELVAILGSNGSGKSSLLNALTFRNRRHHVLTGLRCANGVPLTQKWLKAHSGYVHPDNAFYPNLSVREHLEFHANVRLNKDIPHQMRMRRVEEVLEELGLRQYQDELISNISVYEKKRLAIAAEIITNPSLIFCDEPTSNLDASEASNVAQAMKRLTLNGRTVIMVIQQPSSAIYALFDRVIFMADGKIVFQGTREEADVFFSRFKAPPRPLSYSSSDYYLEMLAIVPGEEESCRKAVHVIWDSYNRSEFAFKMRHKTADAMSQIELSYNDFWSAGPSDNVYENSWISQCKAVFPRCWLTMVKEALLMKRSVLQSIIIAFIIGVFSFNQQSNQEGVRNINGALFILLIAITLQHLFVVFNLFSREFPIFQRDYEKSLYRMDVYLLCKMLADVPIFTLLPVVSVSVCYFMIGLNPTLVCFLSAMSIYVLVTHVIVGFGYLIFCATSSISMAINVASILIISLLLAGGFFLDISTIPFFCNWFSYFSWFRYSFGALMINQWSVIDHITCPVNSTLCPTDGDHVLESYHIKTDEFSEDIIMLVVLILLFRLLAYVCLMMKVGK